MLIEMFDSRVSLPFVTRCYDEDERFCLACLEEFVDEACSDSETKAAKIELTNWTIEGTKVITYLFAPVTRT